MFPKVTARKPPVAGWTVGERRVHAAVCCWYTRNCRYGVNCLASIEIEALI